VKKSILFLFSCILSVLFVPSASALTVSPPILELKVEPGETVAASITLRNEETKSGTFYTSFENFEPRGESGIPFFIGAEDGLATWMQTEPSIELQSQQTTSVPVQITVPAETEPGGYFGAVFFSSQPPASEGSADQLALGGRVGVLVLLRVLGDINEKAGLVEFGLTDNKKVVSNLPVNFFFRFNNVGDDRVAPSGEIKVRNLFGGLTTSIEANTNKGNVLPGSIRRFDKAWEGTPLQDLAEEPEGQVLEMSFADTVRYQFENFYIGRYTASLNLSWGEGPDKNTVASTVFYIIPWQILSVVFGFLILFIGVVKLYNRWLIKNTLRAIELAQANMNAKPVQNPEPAIQEEFPPRKKVSKKAVAVKKDKADSTKKKVTKKRKPKKDQPES
jgi:hypothetical protein